MESERERIEDLCSRESLIGQNTVGFKASFECREGRAGKEQRKGENSRFVLHRKQDTMI